MGVQNSGQDNVCNRKEMISRVRKIIDDLDNAKVEARCCCTQLEKPPPGTKVVIRQTLDGNAAVPKLVPDKKEKYIWIPPVVDNRPALDPSMSCYAATVANKFYDQIKGCKMDCDVQKSEDGAAAPHSHWWNASTSKGSPSGGGMGPDYCEDPNFVPPEPLGHMAWTNEPGGTCKHPQYCKAHCFEHTPNRDWARNY